MVLLFFSGLAMKYFLCLAAVAGFLPVLTLRHEAALKTLLTESTAVQEEIVNLHNTLRRKVIPEASNMLKMSWGEEAAENARTVSKYCDPEGSDPIDRRLENTFCGENIYMSALPYSWSQVIGIWYSESKNFSYGKYVSQDLVITHHYTQLVWASSYLIGCGVAVCRKEKLFHYLYVCHYCHEGNDPERIYLPYKKGTPCGDCPTHCDDKLCTNPCLFYDELTNCETRVKALGCRHSSLKLLCNATCNCNTEIK
ncbi:cysteine-rich secretory protein 1 [Ochotona curzoniae]|uniref:cysteine-rich secretory protein 1 n=1 Tax=Ochotona curzoniae TaxID=130825 RepID=UPI001B352F79|nr:cysteine-rich secretory protein 1 [Ochotona curzoniae]